MGRRGLLLLAAALLLPVASISAVHWITSPVRRERAAGGAGHRPSVQAPRAVDPNLPTYVGNTRRIAADAIDDTAWSAHDVALAALGRQFLATPARQAPGGPPAAERLDLNLTAFDDLSFVEQLLALANSRRVSTRTEAADRFADHVRRLRYSNGQAGACQRLGHAGLWALAAERRGYLVNLSPYLPGSRQRPLAAADLTPDAASAGQNLTHCPKGTGAPAGLTLAYVPLAAAVQALPSLRDGDLFLIVNHSGEAGSSRIGLVEIRGGRLGGIMAEPGAGVVRIPDLIARSHQINGAVGLAFLRPIPNGDGRRDR